MLFHFNFLYVLTTYLLYILVSQRYTVSSIALNTKRDFSRKPGQCLYLHSIYLLPSAHLPTTPPPSGKIAFKRSPNPVATTTTVKPEKQRPINGYLTVPPSRRPGTG